MTESGAGRTGGARNSSARALVESILADSEAIVAETG